MPTIVTASTKGGVGKSMVAVVLATEFAHMGIEVFLYECDSNETVKEWMEETEKRGVMPKNLKVVLDVDESNIIDRIHEDDRDGRMLIIDCQGSASLLNARAMCLADLVLTPLKPKTPDAKKAKDTVRFLAQEEKAIRRKIPHSIVMTQASFVPSVIQRGIVESLDSSGRDFIRPFLMERVPYAMLFSFGGGLRTLPHHDGTIKAIPEAEAFTKAVLERVIASTSGQEGEQQEQRKAG